MPADVANTGLRNKEFLKRSERWEPPYDILGSGHPPRQSLGVPWDRHRRLDRLAIEMVDGGDFRNVSGLEQLLDGERVPRILLVLKLQMQQGRNTNPLEPQNLKLLGSSLFKASQ